MTRLVHLTVDGRPVAVPAGTTLREAALAAGIHTPTLCWHPLFATGANCRICVVEVQGARTLVPACVRVAEDGMAVSTDSPRVRQARRLVLELLFSQADLSAAAGALAYAQYYGARPDRFALTFDRQRPSAHGRTYGHPPEGAVRQRDRAPIHDNPFFVRDYARCIACQRCTEACGAGVQHTFAIGMVGRGAGVVVGVGGTERLTDSPCVFCGNCVGACPTGALVGKHLYEAWQAGEVPLAPPRRWSPATGFVEAEDGTADPAGAEGNGRREVLP